MLVGALFRCMWGLAETSILFLSFIYFYLPTYLLNIYLLNSPLKNIIKRSNYVYFRSLVCGQDYQWPAVHPVHPVHWWSSWRPLPLPNNQAGPTAHNHPYHLNHSISSTVPKLYSLASVPYVTLESTLNSFTFFLGYQYLVQCRFFKANIIVWI